MQDALHQTIEQIPFNSFGYLFKAQGMDLPKEFGGNCVYHLRGLASRLQPETVHFLHSEDRQKSHYTLILPKDNEIYFMDPATLQTNPISLRQVLAGQPSYSNAYPFHEQGSDLIRLSAIDGSRFKMDYILTRGGIFQRNQTYIFDLEQKIDTLPPDDTPQPAYAQQRLLLRLFNNQNSLSYVMVDSFTGKLEVWQLDTGKLTKTSETENGKFTQDLEQIAERLSSTAIEVKEIFGHAFELHRQRFLPSTGS